MIAASLARSLLEFVRWPTTDGDDQRPGSHSLSESPSYHEAAHLGQLEIQQDNVRLEDSRSMDRARTIMRRCNDVSVELEEHAQRVHHVGHVVDDENATDLIISRTHEAFCALSGRARK